MQQEILMGRLLIFIGVLLVLAGVIVLGLERIGLRPGHLPGDLAFRTRNVQVWFPLGTCIVISLLLSGLLYLLSRMRR
jgi:ABC-type Na+ efflux pump permease subunit